MNRVQGDYFETLLYKIFVSIDETTSIAELSNILQIDVSTALVRPERSTCGGLSGPAADKEGRRGVCAGHLSRDRMLCRSTAALASRSKSRSSWSTAPANRWSLTHPGPTPTACSRRAAGTWTRTSPSALFAILGSTVGLTASPSRRVCVHLTVALTASPSRRVCVFIALWALLRPHPVVCVFIPCVCSSPIPLCVCSSHLQARRLCCSRATVREHVGVAARSAHLHPWARKRHRL